MKITKLLSESEALLTEKVVVKSLAFNNTDKVIAIYPSVNLVLHELNDEPIRIDIAMVNGVFGGDYTGNYAAIDNDLDIPRTADECEKRMDGVSGTWMTSMDEWEFINDHGVGYVYIDPNGVCMDKSSSPLSLIRIYRNKNAS